MSLNNRVLPESLLMVQRRKMASKHIPDSKSQEEKENEEISLVNVLNPGDTGLVVGRPPLSPPSPLITPRVELTESTNLLLCDKGQVSPPKTLLGTQFGQGAPLSGSKAVPFEAISHWCSNSGNPAQ